MRTLRLVILLGFLVLPTGSGAQPSLPIPGMSAATSDAEKVVEEASQVETRQALKSPRATMRTFLGAMNELWERPVAGWKKAVSTLDRPEDDPNDGQQEARELYAILNRIELIDVDTLPDVDDVAEKNLESYRFFPNRKTQGAALRRMKRGPVGSIVLAKGEDGLWRFDRNTVEKIPELYQQMRTMPLVAGDEILTVSDYIEDGLPPWLSQQELFSLAYWQWIAIFLLILLGLVVDVVIRLALRRLERTLVRSEEDVTELRRQLRPIGALGALLLWWITVEFLDLGGLVGEILSGTLALLLAVTGTVAAWRLTDLLGDYLKARAKKTTRRIDDVLVPLFIRALKIFVVVMAIVFTASALNLPLTPLLASLGVASVALSFAAKDTVENLFGSIAVLFDRPFDMGDWVVIDGVEGIVEEVGFRSTRVRTFYNSLVTVPNANLVRAVVDNYGRRRYRRWKTTLGVQYDTPPEALVSFTEGIRELVRLHPYTRKDYYEVYCNEFGASSLDILLYVFFEVPDWNTELRERERLFLDIVRLADQLGVEFAFPTSTVHVFSGETPTGPAGRPPERTTEALHILQGAKVAQTLTANQPWRYRKPPPVQITSGPTEVKLDDAGNPIVEVPDADETGDKES